MYLILFLDECELYYDNYSMEEAAESVKTGYEFVDIQKNIENEGCSPICDEYLQAALSSFKCAEISAPNSTLKCKFATSGEKILCNAGQLSEAKTWAQKAASSNSDNATKNIFTLRKVLTRSIQAGCYIDALSCCERLVQIAKNNSNTQCGIYHDILSRYEVTKILLTLMLRKNTSSEDKSTCTVMNFDGINCGVKLGTKENELKLLMESLVKAFMVENVKAFNSSANQISRYLTDEQELLLSLLQKRFS